MENKGDNMNERKQHVLNMAHQLFIDKGFQATSIQDILEYSGISKGTFYNYFSSKNELLIALFKSIYQKLEQDRNELLIGQNPANIEIFIKQIELQMKTNRANKLVSLFEEINFSNDLELKQSMKLGNLRMIRWLYRRFIDIFGESKQPYLLDCAIMFMGILQHNLRYFAMAHESNPNSSIYAVVRYSVERIVNVVTEVSARKEQLIKPELLDTWLPDCNKTEPAFQENLYHVVLVLKKAVSNTDGCVKFIELLDFVQEELLHSKHPRRFLIESTLVSLKSEETFFDKRDLLKLEHLIEDFFTQIKDNN